MYWSNASFVSDLNNWYTSNIKGINDQMVKAIVYCNDISYRDYPDWGTDGRSYGAFDRLCFNKIPSYSCVTGKNNGFGSASKVGMMTADEVVYAGGYELLNSPNTYYYRNSKTNGCIGKTVGVGDPCSVTGDYGWWTLSPSHFASGSAHMLYIGGSILPGSLDRSSDVSNKMVVRPVITLKPEVKVSGSGTTDDPYVPSL